MELEQHQMPTNRRQLHWKTCFCIGGGQKPVSQYANKLTNSLCKLFKKASAKGSKLSSKEVQKARTYLEYYHDGAHSVLLNMLAETNVCD
jgi:hypothetical protein